MLAQLCPFVNSAAALFFLRTHFSAKKKRGARAKRFRFCAGDVSLLLRDFLVLLALTATICLAEMILLLALFHPLGSIV